MEEKSKLHQLSSITTKELVNNLENPNCKLIDVRPIEAYNGWKLKNENRGGHIQRARSIPFKWLKYIDWIEIVRAKGIMPSHSLIIYGYDKLEIEKVANQFIKVGYDDVCVYYNFIDEWSSNNRFPIDKLNRYSQ